MSPSKSLTCIPFVRRSETVVDPNRSIAFTLLLGSLTKLDKSLEALTISPRPKPDSSKSLSLVPPTKSVSAPTPSSFNSSVLRPLSPTNSAGVSSSLTISLPLTPRSFNDCVGALVSF